MSNRTQFIAIIGMLALIFGAYLGALALIGYYDRKEHEKRGEPPRFDERQRIARLRAGNHALYALIIVLILWTVLDQLGYDWLGNIWSMLFCALFLVWGVWSADCILHDGFIGWREQKNIPNSYALTYTVMMLVPASHLRSIASSWLPEVFAFADAAVLCIVVLYKYRKEKRAEREEDAL